MAKKIIETNTVKTILHSAIVNGENIKVRTKKTCMGNPVLADKKCKTCIGHATSHCALVCLTIAKFDKIKKVIPETSEKKKGHGFGEYPDFIKKWANGEKRGGMKKCVEMLVIEGIHTKKQIVQITRNLFPDASKSVPGMYIGHGMKGKGKDAKRFPFKIEVNDGILSFNRELPKGSWGQA